MLYLFKLKFRKKEHQPSNLYFLLERRHGPDVTGVEEGVMWDKRIISGI